MITLRSISSFLDRRRAGIRTGGALPPLILWMSVATTMPGGESPAESALAPGGSAVSAPREDCRRLPYLAGISALLALALGGGFWRYRRANRLLRHDLAEAMATLELRDQQIKHDEEEMQEQQAFIRLQASIRDRLLSNLRKRGEQILQTSQIAESLTQPPAPGTAAANFTTQVNLIFEQLANRMEWFKSIFDSIVTPTFIVDSSDTIIYCNPPFTVLVGEKTINGRLCGDICMEFPMAIRNHHDGCPQEVFRYHDLWLQCRCSWLRDADGRRAGLIISCDDVTERVRSEQIRSDMLNAAPIGSFIVRNDGGKPTILDCNRTMLAMLDTDREHFISRHFDFLPEFQPDGRSTLQVLAEAAKTPDTSREIELLYTDSHGTPVPCHVSCRCLNTVNGALDFVYCQDLRDLRQAEQALENERALMTHVFNTVPDPLWVTDNDGLITTVNPQFLEFFHTATENVRGHDLGAVFSAANAGMLRELAETAVAEGRTGVREIELENSRANRPAFMEVSTTPLLSPSGVADGTLNIGRDISVRVDAARRIEEARELAETNARIKSAFIANMSHEIRTPMNAVLGFLRVAMREETDTKRFATLQKIHTASENLLGIINDILDFSKIEAGKMKIDSITFELGKTVEEVITVVQPRLAEHDVDFLLDVTPGTPRYLVGDPVRLWQILKNLLDNAAKFTLHGNISLRIAYPVATADRPAGIEIQVSDTGIGMTQDQTGHIFAPFEQADTSTTRRFGGTGLGMSITKQLVELMHGNITVSSEPGRGTTFKVFLPLAVAHSETPGTFQTPQNYPPVLVVADTPATRDALANAVRILQIPVKTAGGADALAVFQNGKFSQVFIDEALTAGDAFTLATAMAEARTQQPPAVVLRTSHAFRRTEGKTTAAAYHVWEKPLTPANVAARILELSRQTTEEETREVSAVTSAFTGKSVLVAEDNEINQEVIRAILEPYQIELTIVDNGKKALQAVRDREYDLIFMDIQMPVLDGYAATAAIRALPGNRFRTVPIIAMTAHAFKDEYEHCLQAGMNDHIAKPVDLDILERALKRWLLKE